ncbi:PREDICTED: uncharacterized protein LOC102850618 [Elephantulus edwardii]|uniref:uncharacterized protein LOC102850618 n=1 Tax=Elephantulus edwardii TaxID=28737 RepID=UPI0003F0E7E8|nr:PREDICTED: uncharacterized protein LOC102850618 [Elephantulus edwardii]
MPQPFTAREQKADKKPAAQSRCLYSRTNSKRHTQARTYCSFVGHGYLIGQGSKVQKMWEEPANHQTGEGLRLLMRSAFRVPGSTKFEQSNMSSVICPAILRSLLVACSLASAFFLTASWEIKTSDLEEKNVDEFSSNGLKCPTCFAVQKRKCDAEFRWCSEDKIKCLEFSGIINTGFNNTAIEMKKCIKADLCKEPVTSYMGFPVVNESINCRSATSNGAKIQLPTPVVFVLFLEKLLH